MIKLPLFHITLSALFLLMSSLHTQAQIKLKEEKTIQGISSISVEPKTQDKNYQGNDHFSFTSLYQQSSLFDFSPQMAITSVSNALFPRYVQENPRGYSYLCRLELQVEEKLPVGVWVKFGENNGLNGIVNSPANVRMKLFSF